MPKRATQVILSEREQEALVQITRRHRSEQQQAQRARMIEASAQGDSNAQIARELDVNVDTVRLWRDRWVGLQGIELATRSRAERLRDAPRPGTPPKFTAELMERGIVEQISPRHASYLLKKGVCNRTASDTG